MTTKIVINCIIVIFYNHFYFFFFLRNKHTHTHTRERKMGFNTKTYHNSTQSKNDYFDNNKVIIFNLLISIITSITWTKYIA